jgi:sulfite oxidase
VTRTPLTRRQFITRLAQAGAGSAALAWLTPVQRAALAAGIDPGLIVRNDWPEHLETTVAALGRDPITSNDRFFVRSHFPAPTVDVATWRLEIAGLVRTPATYRLPQLQWSRVEATHTLECAGNGRALFDLPSTSGTQWKLGAVGTARWSGFKLADVLRQAGLAPEAKHVWFEAADEAPLPTAPRFVRSIPLDKAMDDVLLAHTMNGAPLPHLHGAPLRAIVPGWYGMASTKWLTRIRVEDKPSDNHFMAKGYHYVYPGEDPAAALPVETIHIKSLITRPLDGAHVKRGRLSVRGFAWAGPAGVKLVEISIDGGRTWVATKLFEIAPGMAWNPWRAEVTLPARGDVTLMARATDGTNRTQPLAARPNASGYANNSIHRVVLHVAA